MEAGVYTATETQTKTKTDAAPLVVASLAQKSDIVNASRSELDQWVRTVLVWEPSIVVVEEGLSSASSPSDEEDIPDPDEMYDAPEMEKNIEVGEEGAGPSPLEEESSDDFFRWACEKMEVDCDEGLWEELTEILGRIDSGEMSVSKAPEQYRDWLDSLMDEWHLEAQELDEPLLKHPDIVFFVHDGQLAYEIELGPLERIYLNRDADKSDASRVQFKGSDIPVSVIPNLIQWRRISLGILADFLIEKQSAFLLSPDLKTGFSLLRSYEQKDLARYYVNVLDLNKKEGQSKKGEDWASRLLKDKYIKVSFQEEPLPAKFFFDAKIEVVTILQRAVIHHASRTGKRFSFNAMAVILKAFNVMDSKARNISKTYGKFLPSLVQGYDQLGASRITIHELTALINDVGKDLGRLEADLEEEMIASIWEEKK